MVSFYLSVRCLLTIDVDLSSCWGGHVLCSFCARLYGIKTRMGQAHLTESSSTLNKGHRHPKVVRHDLVGSHRQKTRSISGAVCTCSRIKYSPWLKPNLVLPHVLHPGAEHIVLGFGRLGTCKLNFLTHCAS